MGRLEASLRARDELTHAEIDALYALYDRYYGGAGEAAFREDLAAKSHVIVLSEGAETRGFSTLALQPFSVDGAAGLAIFSGDTIVHHEYWGEQALARVFCRFAGATKAANPDVRLYWFLISKGYRTYRYLQAFTHRYFPHPRAATPAPMRRRMDVLARARFGAAYLSESGIVRFEPPRGYLRPQWCGARAGLLARDDVRFFFERNPGYHAGDELVCIAELAETNLRSLARREFAAGMRARAAVPAS